MGNCFGRLCGRGQDEFVDRPRAPGPLPARYARLATAKPEAYIVAATNETLRDFALRHAPYTPASVARPEDMHMIVDAWMAANPGVYVVRKGQRVTIPLRPRTYREEQRRRIPGAA